MVDDPEAEMLAGQGQPWTEVDPEKDTPKPTIGQPTPAQDHAAGSRDGTGADRVRGCGYLPHQMSAMSLVP